MNYFIDSHKRIGNSRYQHILVIGISLVFMLSACQSAINNLEGDASITEGPADADTSTELPPLTDTEFAALPQRAGPATETSGTVPHVQIGVELVEDVNEALFRLAFSLPGVENRPTIVSLPGTRGMWLSDEIALVHPEVIVSGREFAHIHTDGSLHVPLPFDRAVEAAEKGWAERHPWADQREGWDGLVMLFTPQSMAELNVTMQLIVESYNFVTGMDIEISDLTP
jgi:phospholipase/carboxylesterase